MVLVAVAAALVAVEVLEEAAEALAVVDFPENSKRKLRMTFDWLIAKIRRKQYICFNCKKYISNECFNVINPNANMYSDGGGWCVPYENKHIYIAGSPSKNICKKFKKKGTT
jgi:hypothetical protein